MLLTFTFYVTPVVRRRMRRKTKIAKRLCKRERTRHDTFASDARRPTGSVWCTLPHWLTGDVAPALELAIWQHPAAMSIVESCDSENS